MRTKPEPKLRSRRLLGAALVAAAITVCGAAGGSSTASAAGTAGADAYWILLSSNRDGGTRTYSVNADGSRLTPLLPPDRRLAPLAVSRDGSTIAYGAKEDSLGPIYVSRADGTGLRKLAGKGRDPAFSPDGRRVAFLAKNGIWVADTNGNGLRRLAAADDTFDWSPDGKALVFMRVIDAKNDRYAVVMKPLRGRPRVLARTGPNDDAFPSEYQPQWSPDGRWIAYINHENKERRNGLTVVRPNGKRLHRAVLGAGEEDEFEWSPNGRWLAYQNGIDLYSIRPSGDWRKISAHADGLPEWSRDGKRLAFPVLREKSVGEDIAVAGGDARGVRRLQVAVGVAGGLTWLPDAHLAFVGNAGYDPLQIWAVGSDGGGLRRLTNEGSNDLVGWTPLAPVLPPASPLPPTERVTGANTVETSTPIAALSADGPRVAFAPRATVTDCVHVVLWAPGENVLRRLGNLPAPCPGNPPPPVTPLALAGTRAVWVSHGDGADDNCWFALMSATLADPGAREVSATRSDPAPGALCRSGDIDHPRGDGDLLVFDDQLSRPSRLVRIGIGGEKCGDLLCTTLRKDAHATPIDSVSGGLIAIREKAGTVAVLDERGAIVRLFSFTPADVNVALLDGGRLLVSRFGVLEVYDVATGARTLSRPLPAGYILEDVEGGIAVLLRGDTIMLLRLDDGHSLTLTPGGGTLAELESPGLYYSYKAADGGGRLVFVPRSELVLQLGSGAP